MAGILCSGDTYWDRQDDNGNSTGLVLVGNATQFQITESSTIKERTSKMNADYGQVKDSVAIKSPAKIALTLDELNKPNLALICLGSESTTSQTAQTAQTKTFDLSVVAKNIFHEIGASLISVTSVEIASEAMDAEDYELDENGGLIKFTDSAASTGTVTVTYSVAAATGYTINGSAKPTIKGRLLLIGKNLADQSNVRVDVREAVLTPKSGLDFLASDFASAQFEGTLNTPSGESSPYTVTVLAQAV